MCAARCSRGSMHMHAPTARRCAAGAHGGLQNRASAACCLPSLLASAERASQWRLMMRARSHGANLPTALRYCTVCGCASQLPTACTSEHKAASKAVSTAVANDISVSSVSLGHSVGWLSCVSVVRSWRGSRSSNCLCSASGLFKSSLSVTAGYNNNLRVMQHGP